MAKEVFPDYKWVIRSSDIHTTIYCEEKDMVFDIIYWGLDGRIRDHIYEKPYASNDITLGGQLAMESSQ